MTEEQFIEKFVGGRKAFRCVTKERALQLLSLAHAYGFTWSSGTSLLTTSYYGDYRHNTCYVFSRGGNVSYSNTDYYRNRAYEVVTVTASLLSEELRPKDLLEDGFTVVYRSGEKRLVLLQPQSLHRFEDGHRMSSLRDYREDLIHHNKDIRSTQDIMNIYNRENVLIWKRQEKSKEDIELEVIEEKIKALEERREKLKSGYKISEGGTLLWKTEVE